MTIRQILISALFIRLLIIPFFFHPDIKDINLRVSFLTSNGVTNIYEFLTHNPTTKVHAPDFVYPPITYFFLGGYQTIVHPLLGDNFNSWLFDFSGFASTSDYIFRYLLILKIPYLIFDFMIGFLLLKIFKDESSQKKALFFWFFNPLNLYGTYMIGQFDIIPTSLMFFAWFLWEKKNSFTPGLLLGLGVSFKTFPLLLIPFFILDRKPQKQTIIFCLTAILTYLLTIFPFITSTAFQQNVLFSGLGQRIFELHLNLLGVHISIFMLMYFLLLGVKYYFKELPLWSLITVTLLSMYALINFHPQWVIWVLPFLTLAFVKVKLNIWTVFSFFLIFFLIFIFYGDRFLLTGLLSPISPQFLEIPSITQLLDPKKVSIIMNIIHIFFGFSSGLIIWKVLKFK